jgi:hypothetical protein
MSMSDMSLGAGLGGGEGSREDAQEFVGFLPEKPEFWGWDYLGFFKQHEPEQGLIGFFDRGSELAGEVRARLGPTGGAIVGGNRRAGT